MSKQQIVSGHPLTVVITGWSPFEPGDPDNSSLPVAALECRFVNCGKTPLEAVFSFNAKNFMAVDKSEQAVRPVAGGFILWSGGPKDKPWDEGAFSATVPEPAAKVNHAWFRGGWWDALTLAWKDVAEAAAANLTILKSPTVLRQTDGRLWSWEGCGDNSGCCHGSCTHVWNYAQAIPHLFSGLERTLRETEFGHWYARAMSSYALLFGLSGARYDAVEKILYLKPGLKGDFRCFFSAATGVGRMTRAACIFRLRV